MHRARSNIVLQAAATGAIGSEEHQGVKEFGKRLEELSNGRIKVDTFGLELGDPMSQIEHVMDGTQQVWLGELAWLANVHKDLNIGAMAFTFRSVDHLNRFLKSERGSQIWKELMEKNGIRVLDFSGQRLPRVVMCKRLLSSIDDFQGLKMRFPEYRFTCASGSILEHQLIGSPGEKFILPCLPV